MPITRRTVLGLLSGSTFFLTALPSGRVSALAPSAQAFEFPQGVASADPQPDGVMLWTRAVPLQPSSSGVLTVQVSSSATFEDLILEAPVTASAANDYTVRVYVDGLQNNRHYYYRFIGGDQSQSRVGRTCTAPATEVKHNPNVAFVSCQNYEQAHYGSWARMLEDDKAKPPAEQINFVLHLGDFVYERTWPKRKDGSPQPRQLPPFPDGVVDGENVYAQSLADYRHLYKVYLSDPHLQEARARWPFICTWDDHEFSNDSFQSFSNYHKTPRLDAARKLHGNQAWFEFIPAVLDELPEQPAYNFRQVSLSEDDEERNSSALNSLCIYRKLRWGKHLDLLLTDSRSYRSEACLKDGLAQSLGLPLDTVKLVEITDGGSDYDNGQPPATLPYGDGSVPNPAANRPPGTMLGGAQRQWFLEQLENSSARWKLWGNALPIIPIRLDLSSLPFSSYEDGIFHLDAWPGYPSEQRKIMEFVEAQKITGLVSFSGDHHMHGAGTINKSASEPDTPAVAVDFNVAGISSTPFFEELYEAAQTHSAAFRALAYKETAKGIIPVWNMTLLRGTLASFVYSKTNVLSAAQWLGPNPANPGLKYVDTQAIGYGLAQFTADELQVQLVTVHNPTTQSAATPKIEHLARFKLPLWEAGSAPQLSGPEFELGAPFPFNPP